MAFGSLWRRWRGDSSPGLAQSPPTVVEAAPIQIPVEAPEARELPAAAPCTASAEPKVREVSTIAELDAVLNEVDAAQAISDDAVRAAYDRSGTSSTSRPCRPILTHRSTQSASSTSMS